MVSRTERASKAGEPGLTDLGEQDSKEKIGKEDANELERVVGGLSEARRGLAHTTGPALGKSSQ